jgi:hypothetical protein
MMNTLKFTSLLLIFVLGLGIASVNAEGADVAITLERTACFGTCPVYTVSILEDGTVLYDGKDFVEVKGEQTGQIEPEMVTAMVDAFEDAGYFDWNDAYDTQEITDMPTVTTSVTRDGETHTILHYLGDHSAPLALPFLEFWIDQMANTSMWTGAESDISNISNGTGTPLLTLQRTPCFGFCPVYSMAAFEDGTIVYIGMAHVDRIGVQILSVEASLVTGAAERAGIFGYFKWQDSYEDYMMTDQSTVISSVRWEDQYKRVVRYEGDPSAPIGLTWVEDSIDQLIATPAD